jgi:cobalt/nickel transport system permease protein
MVGSLFLRSYERSERIYNAMQARGFDGEFRYLAGPPLGRSEIAAFALGLALVVVYALLGLFVLPAL